MHPATEEPGAGRAVDLEPIEADHSTLRTLMARLDDQLGRIAGGDASLEAEALTAVEQFCRILTGHLEMEETTGVLEQAAQAEPRLADRAEALLAEHDDLRRGVEDLSSRVSEGDWGGFHARFTAFCSMLSSHEQAENEVLMEAYLDDIGGHN